MYCSPNFLVVVFKQQEISQQVLFHNFLLFFFGPNEQGHKRSRKVEILELI